MRFVSLPARGWWLRMFNHAFVCRRIRFVLFGFGVRAMFLLDIPPARFAVVRL